MQLCDRDIYQAIVNESIGFVGTNEKYPFLPEKQVQPASIDLRLGDIIVRFKDNITSFDIKNPIVPEEHLDVERYQDGQPIIIAPGEIVYGQIYEQMWIGDLYSARVEGRSRVARLGLSVHCSGSYINPGFCGAMPLQLINHNRFYVTIYPYIGICQLILFEISGEPLVKYSDRSRIYNPYFDEAIASPSVLRPPSQEHLQKQSIAEYRMRQLVKEYYRGLEKDRPNRRKRRNEDKLVDRIVVNNYQQGSFSPMRDSYTATQAGTQGPNSGQNATIMMQSTTDAPIDYSALLHELDLIRNHIRTSESSSEESDILLGDVSRASKALKENRRGDALQILKSAGVKLRDIAISIGCSLIVKIITNRGAS